MTGNPFDAPHLRPSDYWTRDIRRYVVVHDLEGSTRSDRSRDAPTNSGKK